MYQTFTLYIFTYIALSVVVIVWEKNAKNAFQPQLILYNAGTDILSGDPLGRMLVSFCISFGTQLSNHNLHTIHRI